MNRRRVGSTRPFALGVAAVMVSALLALFGLLTFAPESFAADAAGSPQANAAPPNALPPNPALDARITTYLQKRFVIADPSRIQLGPVTPTPMAGVYSRSLRVSYGMGQTQTATIFTNAAEDLMTLSEGQGEMYDLTKDPWQKVDLKPLHLEDRPTMGPADAPVTIIEFADFECPHCARAFETLETMVHSTHKDKVRVICKNYPLNGHLWATRAAIGAECARLQNPEAFWDFARDYYSNQGSITPGDIDDHIHATARRLSLDVTTLDACIAGEAARARVDEDQRDGAALGVDTTPTMFINGVRVVGVPDDFAWVVTQQLDETGKGKEMLRR